MPYTTVAEVRLNHELISKNADADSAISMHILGVDDLIDGMIRAKVTIPFDGEAPEIIKSISRDLVTFRTLRSLYGSQVPDYQTWLDQYKVEQMDLLEEIRDCKIILDPDLTTLLSRIKSNTKGKEAIFNLGDPESQNYHPDNDDRYGENR